MDNTLLDTIASRSGLDAALAAKLTDSLAPTLTAIAMEGDNVAVPGFGTFTPRLIEEHVEGDMLVPPEMVLEYKSSVVLRKRLQR